MWWSKDDNVEDDSGDVSGDTTEMSNRERNGIKEFSTCDDPSTVW